ncbi:hypothetical protein D3C76_1084370 [compost metagenome]
MAGTCEVAAFDVHGAGRFNLQVVGAQRTGMCLLLGVGGVSGITPRLLAAFALVASGIGFSDTCTDIYVALTLQVQALLRLKGGALKCHIALRFQADVTAAV